MKTFVATVAVGNGNENRKFQTLADEVTEYLKTRGLFFTDVVWLQSSGERYITLTAIVG
jgi:hypothetical protein